jgi:hypothetical protein
LLAELRTFSRVRERLGYSIWMTTSTGRFWPDTAAGDNIVSAYCSAYQRRHTILRHSQTPVATPDVSARLVLILSSKNFRAGCLRQRADLNITVSVPGRKTILPGKNARVPARLQRQKPQAPAPAWRQRHMDQRFHALNGITCRSSASHAA